MRKLQVALVSAILFVLAPTASEAAPVIGTNTVGTGIDGNTPGKAQDYRATASATSAVDRLNIYLDGSNTAATVELGLYTSNSGGSSATARLGRCVITGIPTNTPGWQACTITSVNIVSGTRYWVAVLHPSGASGNLQYRNKSPSTGGSTFTSSNLTLPSLPTSWTNGTNWGAQMASIYADLAQIPTPTPTPTATPTPTVTPTPTPPPGCPSTVANTADGPDAFGGCFPGPQSTGVPAGTTLTNYTGPCTITVANTVIDSKTVNCDLVIATAGVQISNSQINGNVWIDDPTPNYSFTITDSTVDAGPVDAVHNDGKRALGKSHFTAIRVETVRGIGGAWCEYDCTIRDSWIHGQDKDEGGAAHESGIRQGSGSAQNVVHNTIICDAPDVAPDAGCSADITGYGDFATIQNNLLERNLLLATTGGTCAYGGSSSPKPYPNGANNVWRDNVFQRSSFIQPSGHCGFWFAITSLDAGIRGNQWINNRWDTGELMPSEG